MSETKQAQVTEQRENVQDKVHTFTQSELDTYIANIQKEKYETGKQTGVEMTLKNLKKTFSEKYKVATDGVKSFEELFELTLNQNVASYKQQVEELNSKLTGETKSIVEKYESEKQQLQRLINEKENEFAQLIGQKENEIFRIKSDLLINREIDNLSFDVPASIAAQGEKEMINFLSIERQKAAILFSNLYKIEFDGSGEVIVKNKNGEVLKDRLQNPEKLSVIVQNFAKDYNFNVKKASDSKNLTGSKAANIAYSNMNEAQFKQYANENNIDLRTNDGLKVYADWRKSQTK
jgi:molybdenum-dependent DNA-binding transcriptional regulator ModE